MKTSSTPTFSEFDPEHIYYQSVVIDKVKNKFDYSKGVYEVLLSGSVGSAKSLLMAHLAIRHCVEYPGARFLIGRKTLPDLKETLLRKIFEHLEGTFIEGYHYWKNITTAKVKFRNGSEIISRSWHDKKFMKFRSLELSGVAIEELTENDEEDKEAVQELKMRVGRLPHVPENIILYATNPDSPQHWAYDYFQLGLDADLQDSYAQPIQRKPLKFVYYSKTEENPFLPQSYKDQLKEDLDPKMYERMGLGRWIEIKAESIYYQYSTKKNFIEQKYEVDPEYPIHITWDFNIGMGKPLSLVCFQWIDSKFHFFNEIVVEGIDTYESLEELASTRILDYDVKYLIHGDASGASRSTTSKRSDYDIIKKYMANHRNCLGNPLDFEMKVPKANPPVRERHNIVNAYCYNANKEVRLFVYKDAKTLDKGFRLTNFKKTGNYVEDDSKYYQHITTAAGYGIVYCHKSSRRKVPVKRVRIR